MLKKIKNVLVSVAIIAGVQSVIIGADTVIKAQENEPKHVRLVSELPEYGELKPIKEEDVHDLFRNIHQNTTVLETKTVQDAIVHYELRDIKLNQLETKSDLLAKGLLPENIENYHFDVENEPAVDVTQEEIDKVFETEPVEHVHHDEVMDAEKDKRTFVVTYYTSLGVENGGWENMAARGDELKEGMVATSAEVPFDTKFNLPNIGQVNVSDRMAGWAVEKRKEDHGVDTIPVDVFVPRNEGESDQDYFNRVDKMGVNVVEGTVDSWGTPEV